MTRAVLLIMLLIAATTQPGRASDDRVAIRAAVTDYIEGYYLSDPLLAQYLVKYR